jgi:tetratricopeptide (TPR) repeat protein
MSRRISLALSAIIAGTGLAAATVREVTHAGARKAALPAMSGLAVSEREIAFYQKRVAEDTASAADQARLAALFLQRARESGDYEDFRRSERAARRSLELRHARNGGGMLALASSLLAQHRFIEARAVAAALCALAPEETGFLALRAELELEIGDYDAAKASFDSLASERRNLAVAPRLARWAELRGDVELARRMLYEALLHARGRTDLPREQVAWFFLRVGDIELRSGRLDDAERALRAGLELEPGDHRLLAALARVEALRGRWPKVVELGERIGDRADIATLALIGDAHRELSNPTAAARYHDEAEAAGRENPEPYNRQWTLFQLDHDRNLSLTLELLQEEIEGRRDVYGYDQLAWALYKQGRFAEARQAMAMAMRLGTEDAVLHYHAGMIELGLGNVERASDQLRRAIAINRYFHHRDARVALQVLDSLSRTPRSATSLARR